MSHNKVLIIGGGLAGLYAAWCLQQQGIPYL
jgi:monoamine oxidase